MGCAVLELSLASEARWDPPQRTDSDIKERSAEILHVILTPEPDQPVTPQERLGGKSC